MNEKKIFVIIIYYYFYLLLLTQFFNVFKYQKINIKYLILTLFISLYISDLFTGLVHIFLDNYKGNNKFIKPFAISFQKHHDDPKSLNNLPFFEIIWGTSNFFLYLLLF